jgi:dephospho-CoA kinase
MLRARCPGVAALVGLTGGIGSGKSSAMAVMRDLGAAAVVDADKVAHRAYLRGQPTFDQLVHAFGADIVGADGA